MGRPNRRRRNIGAVFLIAASVRWSKSGPTTFSASPIRRIIEDIPQRAGPRRAPHASSTNGISARHRTLRVRCATQIVDAGLNRLDLSFQGMTAPIAARGRYAARRVLRDRNVLDDDLVFLNSAKNSRVTAAQQHDTVTGRPSRLLRGARAACRRRADRRRNPGNRREWVTANLEFAKRPR